MLLKLDSQRRLERQWETAVLALFGTPICLDVHGRKIMAPLRGQKGRVGKRRRVEGGEWTSGLQVFERRKGGRDGVRVAAPLRFGLGCNKGMSVGGVVLRLAAATYGCDPGENLWRARTAWGEPGHEGRAPAKQWWRGRVSRQVVQVGGALGATLDALLILFLTKVQFPGIGRFAIGLLTAVKLGCLALSSPFISKSPLVLHNSSPSPPQGASAHPLPQLIPPLQHWSNRIQDFASAAMVITAGKPIVKFGFPHLHELLRAIGAAVEVGRGYAVVRAKARRLGFGEEAAGEQLWRVQHRWAAKRLCRLLHDLREPPSLGWVFTLVESLTVETRTIPGIASSHYSILGYGSPPPHTQFRQLSVSMPAPTVPLIRHLTSSGDASWHDGPVRLADKPPALRQLSGTETTIEEVGLSEEPSARWRDVSRLEVGFSSSEEHDRFVEVEDFSSGGEEATSVSERAVDTSPQHSLQRKSYRGETSGREYEWERFDEVSEVGVAGEGSWGDRLGLWLRALWLAFVFVPLLVLGPLLWFLGDRLVPSQRDKVRAVIWTMLRWCLERGGAAFIKWGQWSATREDLFPADLCTTLGRMHDRAPTHSYRQTRDAVLKYFGRPIEDIFESFEAVPAASGSIAQVHRAELRLTESDPPVSVAVKVRHPAVALRIYQDFRILSALADVAQKLPALRWLNLRQSVDQFSYTMTAQADLRVEARNLLRFSRNFNDLDQTVVFPRLFAELVSEGVLVESFEDGSPLHVFLRDRSSSLNTQIAAIGVDAYMKMMLTDNFVHTDLHPGNILCRMAPPVVHSDASGAPPRVGTDKVQMVVLDFGLAEELSPAVRFNFLSFITHIGTGDGERAAGFLLRFSEPDPQRCTSPENLISDMRTLFAESCDLLQGPIDLNNVLKQVLRLCHKHEVTINSSYASLIVAVCVIVGFANSLDPMLSIMDAAVPCLFLYNLTGRIVGRIYD